ncbi:MAG: hydroxyproline-2-epimerase [Leptolyngbya sp. PLA1]|nr:hydroxyproline-2-epimerase [Leptolyngbya sp. PLA1]
MPHARVQVIDSHTEGEPTRVVLDGGPDLARHAGGPRPSVAAQAQVMRDRFDWFRAAVCNEPRGNDALVGALLVPPALPDAVCGVIFFNNVGLLNACGHGTIGLAATLRHLGRIGVGTHTIETPVGSVAVQLDPQGGISIENVPAFRYAAGVEVPFSLFGEQRRVTGDIAWGGNWFFLAQDHGQDLSLRNLDTLRAYCLALRAGIDHAGIRADPSLGRGEIDHIELFGPPTRADCDSRNYVLCPGGAYDRSPCGTGTSAKMACLFADGKLRERQQWRQESIIASRFVGSVHLRGDLLIPTIRGGAWVTGESSLVLDDSDPFVHGIR